MGLKLIVDKLDEIPEASRELYKEVDGKYRLDLDGYEDPVGLKSALQAERKRASDNEKAAKAWASLGKTPDEIHDLLAAQQKLEEDKAAKGGEWDKLKTQMLDQHKAEIAKREEVVGKMRANLERNLVDAQAVSALHELKGEPGLLLPHVKAHVKVIEDGDAYVVRVVDDRGEPRVNGKGEFLSIKDLVSEMRQSPIFGRGFDASGNSGAGALPGAGGGGGGGPAKKAKDMTVAEKAKFMADFGIEKWSEKVHNDYATVKT